ncbi:MAG TPA: radical SAM protein [bacterium]|nr:radical SAM protein [bacterium]
MIIDLIRVPDTKTIDDLLDEPLGLLYLAASLKKKGYEVRITNFAGFNEDNWKNEIKEADIYGIQLYTPTAHLGIEIAKYIKSIFPDKPIICGGAHPSALPYSPELKIFDVIVIGEGENTIVNIADNYNNGITPPKIIKSCYIENIDNLAFPDRSMVNMFEFHRKVNGKRCFGILGSRGCSYHCAFCDQALFGNKIRFRSIDNIISEIKHIIEKYNIRAFEFFDDMFTVSKKRLIEFNFKIKDYNIEYRCNGRTDINDQETYNLLYESGCRLICFGIESGSQKILNLMNKHNTVENAYKAISNAKKAGLLVAGYFLIGFPGETTDTIKETINFINQSNIDQAQGYTFVPLPGCDVYKNPEKYGILEMSKDYSDYYLIQGKHGLGGKTISTKFLNAYELESEVKKFREFLKNRTTKGCVQDYYKNQLNFNVK